jgi:uncharacterized membrane protein (DUF106 family)
MKPITRVFLSGAFAGIINMSVLTYILIDNERYNNTQKIKKNLPVQMR